MYTYTDYNIHGTIPLLSFSPCWFPLLPFLFPFHFLCTLFYLLGTLQLWQECPPQTQVGDKLTHLDPPLSQPTPFLQIPRTPTAQRLTKTTSGIFRLLLSGTLNCRSLAPFYEHFLITSYENLFFCLLKRILTDWGGRLLLFNRLCWNLRWMCIMEKPNPRFTFKW